MYISAARFRDYETRSGPLSAQAPESAFTPGLYQQQPWLHPQKGRSSYQRHNEANSNAACPSWDCVQPMLIDFLKINQLTDMFPRENMSN